MQSGNCTVQPATAAHGAAMPFPKLMYSKREAAEMLSISIRTLDYLITNNRITIRRIGKRILIQHQELVRFSKQDHQTGRVQ